MEWLSGFLDQIIVFFQWIWDFFAQGIYDFVRDGRRRSAWTCRSAYRRRSSADRASMPSAVSGSMPGEYTPRGPPRRRSGRRW